MQQYVFVIYHLQYVFFVTLLLYRYGVKHNIINQLINLSINQFANQTYIKKRSKHLFLFLHILKRLNYQKNNKILSSDEGKNHSRYTCNIFSEQLITSHNDFKREKV